jgi:16S rRNA U516 pseudouridylate synthase RsuA-like enzyme
MNVWQWLCALHKVCHFTSIERQGKASHSELKRWIEQHNIMFNFLTPKNTPKWNDPMDFEIISVILFPKNQKKRCTLFHKPNHHIIEIDEACLQKELEK